jgi:hypothetical protein
MRFLIELGTTSSCSSERLPGTISYISLDANVLRRFGPGCDMDTRSNSGAGLEDEGTLTLACRREGVRGATRARARVTEDKDGLVGEAIVDFFPLTERGVVWGVTPGNAAAVRLRGDLRHVTSSCSSSGAVSELIDSMPDAA